MAAKRTFNVRWISAGRGVDFDAAPDRSVEYAGQPLTISR